MIDKQQQVTINLNEYVTYEQKVEVVEGLMELLDLEYDREDQIITLKRDNEDILQLAIEKYERLKAIKMADKTFDNLFPYKK
jgi:hypothetical protein